MVRETDTLMTSSYEKGGISSRDEIGVLLLNRLKGLNYEIKECKRCSDSFRLIDIIEGYK